MEIPERDTRMAPGGEMSDDREEFEMDQVAHDGEGEPRCESDLPDCGPAARRSADDVPLCERCYQGLAAEHGMGFGMMTDAMIEDGEGEPAAPPGPRFGERVRAEIDRAEKEGYGNGILILNLWHVRQLAAAIDADAALIGADAVRYAAELNVKRLAVLRQRIEAAARERLVGPEAISLPEFLAALAEIFGEGPAEMSAESPPFLNCPGGGKIVSGLLAVAACPTCGRVFRQKEGVFGRPEIPLNMWVLPAHLAGGAR